MPYLDRDDRREAARRHANRCRRQWVAAQRCAKCGRTDELKVCTESGHPKLSWRAGGPSHRHLVVLCAPCWRARRPVPRCQTCDAVLRDGRGRRCRACWLARGGARRSRAEKPPVYVAAPARAEKPATPVPEGVCRRCRRELPDSKVCARCVEGLLNVRLEQVA